MQFEENNQRTVVGGYSSHGWIRESKQGGLIKQIGKGLMDLNIMGKGGDETTFLFNLTQNLRFDTLKNKAISDSFYT